MKEFLIGLARVVLVAADDKEEAKRIFYEELSSQVSQDDFTIKEVEVV